MNLEIKDGRLTAVHQIGMSQSQPVTERLVDHTVLAIGTTTPDASIPLILTLNYIIPKLHHSLQVKLVLKLPPFFNDSTSLLTSLRFSWQEICSNITSKNIAYEVKIRLCIFSP